MSARRRGKLSPLADGRSGIYSFSSAILSSAPPSRTSPCPTTPPSPASRPAPSRPHGRRPPRHGLRARSLTPVAALGETRAVLDAHLAAYRRELAHPGPYARDLAEAVACAQLRAARAEHLEAQLLARAAEEAGDLAAPGTRAAWALVLRYRREAELSAKPRPPGAGGAGPRPRRRPAARTRTRPRRRKRSSTRPSRTFPRSNPGSRKRRRSSRLSPPRRPPTTTMPSEPEPTPEPRRTTRADPAPSRPTPTRRPARTATCRCCSAPCGPSPASTAPRSPASAPACRRASGCGRGRCWPCWRARPGSGTSRPSPGCGPVADLIDGLEAG